MTTDTDLETMSDKRRAARMDQVLDAAVDCFREFGFHRASMNRIAKQAGMSVGHIYHYFENKEAIIAAIVDRESKLAAERFTELNSIPKDELVEVMSERVARAMQDKAGSFQSVLNLEILAECERNPQIAHIVHAHDAEIRAMFSCILGDKLGLPDVDARTNLLMSLFSGVSARVQRNPDLDSEALLPLVRDVIRFILKAQE